MDIIVIGAGVIGVSTAWEMAQRGHKVLVFDAAEQPASGASHANGAQISPSEAVPWASPHNLRMALKWMWQSDSPFRLRLGGDTRQWHWLARFLANCRTSAWDRNASSMVELALSSQSRLREIRELTGIEYDREDRGILRIYRSAGHLSESLAEIQAMRRFGVDMTRLDNDEIGNLEPALLPAIKHGEIAGGILASGDETGDARMFTEKLAQQAELAGVTFRWGVSCGRISTHGDRVDRLETGEGDHTADAVVLCAGLGSPALTRPLGFDLPIYPLKGYSLTQELAATDRAPRISVTDENRRMVISRLGNRIRAAGKADLIGYDRRIDPVRVDSLRSDLERIYPDMDYAGSPEAWTDLRPMTPDGIPLIGPSAVQGLWLNTGHGSLGWTMACGSAVRVADQIEGVWR